MFIFSDFLSHAFILLVVAGAVTFFLFDMKKDIELTIGKNKIQEIRVAPVLVSIYHALRILLLQSIDQ